MMSLFSSFDSFTFFLNHLTLLIFVWLGWRKIFPLTFLFSTFGFLNLHLGSFFNSLNSSNFSKNFDFFIFFVMVMFIMLNFSSIFSFIFPLTSQMSLILFFSLSIWIGMMTFSFFYKFKGSFSHFIPEGAPLLLCFFLFLIELVSLSIRPITLTVRLLANILAGHLLIILLCSLVDLFNFCFPLLMLLNMVEMFVSLIQSYIFVTLLTLYYSEI